MYVKSQHGWEIRHLFSGYSREEYRSKVLLMLQAYIDDSGCGGVSDDKIFVLSGFIAHAPAWEEFSSDWSRCLDEDPKLHHLSMRNVAKWRNVDRKVKKLSALSDVLLRYAKKRIECSILVKDYRAVVKGHVPKAVDSPYFLAFHNVIARFCDDCWANGINRKVEIFFDDNKVFGQRAKRWYPMVRDLVPSSHRRVLPAEPFFRDDKLVMPLQAADMSAWLISEKANTGGSDWRWLRKRLNTIEQIICPPLNQARLRAQIAERQISPKLLSKWKNL